MRQRDARGSGAANTGADARHNAERDPGGGQSKRFLATPTEYQRIAALQPHNAQPLAGELDQPVIDAKLLSANPTRTLAGQFQNRARRQRQDRLRHQRIMHNDIGATERIRRVQRQQPGVARTGADKPDRALVETRAGQIGKIHRNGVPWNAKTV